LHLNLSAQVILLAARQQTPLIVPHTPIQLEKDPNLLCKNVRSKTARTANAALTWVRASKIRQALHHPSKIYHPESVVNVHEEKYNTRLDKGVNLGIS